MSGELRVSLTLEKLQDLEKLGHTIERGLGITIAELRPHPLAEDPSRRFSLDQLWRFFNRLSDCDYQIRTLLWELDRTRITLPKP
jgi:hypothetical protein